MTPADAVAATAACGWRCYSCGAMLEVEARPIAGDPATVPAMVCRTHGLLAYIPPPAARESRR